MWITLWITLCSRRQDAIRSNYYSVLIMGKLFFIVYFQNDNVIT